MLSITTPTVEGGKIPEYKGVVMNETTIGTNVSRDFFTGIRDVIGGRNNAYEKVLREAKDTSLYEMQERAEALGANTIVGIDIDYETTEQSGSILMVAVNGAAVLV